MTVAIFLGALLGPMALGVPIAFALIVSGVALMMYLGMFDAQIVAQNVLNGADSFPLMAVPFFMLAGEVMNTGGLSRRIVDLAMALVGHIRGGLGFVAIFAACVLSSLSGSAVADAAALGTLLLPMMLKSGHDPARAGGLLASASIIGPIIPPSIGFILYGVVGGVSITKLFLAGIFPGLLIAVALCITWLIVASKEQFSLPPRQSGAVRLKAFIDSIWALMLPLIIIVGLKFGVFTPTEAGVVAAVYSLFVAMVIYRELPPARLFHVFVAAAKITAVVMFLVAAAAVSAWLITVADVPGDLAALIQPLMGNQTLLLLAIMVLVVLVGTAMDMTPTILIMTPVLMPIIKEAGIDPVYFGVLFIINNSIGLITPPVGTVLNVICGISKLSMEELMKGVMPFLIAELIVLLLLVLFPQLVMVPVSWLGH
ncbi:TRAP transporter large permease [Phyllobacterium zundukense]|uniref:TRAP transporter large permease protein n=1 Tax=Phyllobacterium zundukense TaxID=1867719 RepID=A0A2N9VV62_9HYPH|nr:TRAP transporter large permease subunit [Phyllobacterium zundukense]ATU94070.1 L-dehydroascorbate transporter large permease subunit [Phyllobacterium zundukense]PIO43380.1 L-dehydroascorbate transporter large permease subunit [Phyllobacterium zundukense]